MRERERESERSPFESLFFVLFHSYLVLEEKKVAFFILVSRMWRKRLFNLEQSIGEKPVILWARS